MSDDANLFDLPVEMPGRKHVYQMYTIKLKGIDRTKFLADLRAQGIGATVHFDPPVHTQPFYAELCGSANLDLSVTNKIAATIATLPMYPTMTADDVAFVANAANVAAVKYRI